jgi:hypothetical protein
MIGYVLVGPTGVFRGSTPERHRRLLWRLERAYNVFTRLGIGRSAM